VACEKGDTVTYHGEHKKDFFLNHINSLPEQIRYLEHFTISLLNT